MRSRDVFKKKIFRTSTFFCFCMMLVCLIFMLLINNIAIHSIEEQVIQKEEVRLDDIELALNKQIMSIHKFSLNIAANSDLRKDIYMLRENDKTRLGDITKSISMYMNSGGYELDYLVFIDDTNYCISRGGILEKDIAEKLYVTESNLIGRENWDLINNGEYKNMYINIPNQSAEGMDNTVASDKLKLSNVCYILTIMNPYKTEPMATIMVSLDEEQIFGGIKELEKTHVAGVMDSSGKLLLSSHNSVADEDVAEISKDYNEFNAPDIDSTPDNKVDGEDDIDDAPVMLSIILGQNTKTYFGITILMLATTEIGITLIKKFVL